ncbi:MAG TPA: L,D-transpeptidase [Spirochaetales bacterium]|nr:L,D-transpeptidase [Spirochaetales bacterium]HPS15315.1 L,D-transpeptidase [Spirochaetales bacterium]
MHYTQWRGARIFSRAGLLIVAFVCLVVPIWGPPKVAASARFEKTDAEEPWQDLGAEEDLEFLLRGKYVDEVEAAKVQGGDTRVTLDSSRTKLKVEVIDSEYEAKLGRIPPKETYVIDVHNRVMQTTEAPFMPKPGTQNVAPHGPGVTCAPEPFPAGNWQITGERARGDKYGPFSIQTNAVGHVDVYGPVGPEGRAAYLGTYADTGYSLHSNTIPFERSLSYGCIVMRQDDVSKLATTLLIDKGRDPKARQTIYVPDKK